MLPASENLEIKSGGVISELRSSCAVCHPTDEFISNKENVEYAVANLLKGIILMLLAFEFGTVNPKQTN